MSAPSRFFHPTRNLAEAWHHGRRAQREYERQQAEHIANGSWEPPVPGFELVPEQLWECACGKVRQWGHGEAEGVSHEAFLLCLDCEGHTLHAYAGVAE